MGYVSFREGTFHEILVYRDPKVWSNLLRNAFGKPCEYTSCLIFRVPYFMAHEIITT